MTQAQRTTATGTDAEIVVTRQYDAPPSLVFAAWTRPEQLMRWWAPEGCTTPVCRVDLRVGGIFHYCMRMPDGIEVWGLGRYLEIVEPERIVYTDSFADAQGNPVPPSHYGASASHPAETVVTVTFEPHAGGTRLTLRHNVPVTTEERGATAVGWTQMLDRLAEELASARGDAR